MDEKKLALAKKLIIEGSIKTLNDLYKFIPVTIFAKELGYTIQHYRKYKAGNPIGFKLSELKQLSLNLNIPLNYLLRIFFASIPDYLNDEDKKALNI